MVCEFDQLKHQLRDFAEARDWVQFHTPKNLSMALMVEAAELMEHFQWKTELQSKKLSETEQQEVADEVADVLLYLLRLADQLDIDVVQAAQHKMIKNAQKYPVEVSYGRAKYVDDNNMSSE